MAHKTVMRYEGKTTYCGDHYCSGHTNAEWKCECGEVVAHGDNVKLADAQFKHLAHRVTILEDNVPLADILMS